MSQTFTYISSPPPNGADESMASPANGEFRYISTIPPGYDAGTTGIVTRQSVSLTPEAAAVDFSLAEQFGQPVGVVSRNRDMFKNMALTDAVNRTLASAPAVRGLYNSDPRRAALLRDDLENAVDLNARFQQYSAEVDARFQRDRAPFAAERKLAERRAAEPQYLWTRLPRRVLEGVSDLSENFWQFVYGAMENTSSKPMLSAYLPGGNEGAPQESLADSPAGEWLRGYLERRKEMRRETYLLPSESTVGGFVEDLARMAPQFGAQAATYLAGGAPLSLLFMGSQISGSQYGQLTEGESIDRGRAFLASLANAGLQAPLEAFSMGKALNIFRATGLGKLFRTGGEAMVTEFSTELLQQYPEALTDLWAEAEARGRDAGDTWRYFFNNLGEYTKEGAYQGLLAAVYGLVGAGGKIGYEYGMYRAGARDGAFFQALDESAEGSKTRARLPKEYARLVENITAGGPVDNVYVSPHVLRSAIGDDAAFYQLAEEVGLSGEEVRRSEAMGTDLEIPLARYQARIAGTDLSLAIRDSVKFHPEDMSLAERQEFEKTAPARLAEVLKRVEGDAESRSALDTVLAPIEEQLSTLYGKEATRANMAVLRARAQIAADWWTQAGEPLTPAQVVTDKWGLRLDVNEGNAVARNDLAQMAAPDVRAVTDGIQAADASPVTVVQNVAELPENLRAYGENSIALYDPPTDTVWMIADNIESPERAAQAWAHEQIVHHGLRGLYSQEERASLMDGLWEKTGGLNNAFVREIADRYGLDASTDQGRRLTMEETLAALAEKRQSGQAFTEQESSLWQRVVEAFRRAFNTLMGRTDADALLKNEDVDALLSRLGKHVLEGVKGGDSLYQTRQEGVGPRGSISFADGQSVIRLFKDSADLSTFAHESAHLFMRDMQSLVDTGNAPAQVAADLAALKRFTADYTDPRRLKEFYDKAYRTSREGYAGREFMDLSTDEIAQVQHVAEQEKLADAFLTYLREGKAPSVELRSAFRRFRDWLKGLYQSVMGHVEITAEVRSVFDRMLASEADIRLVEQMHGLDAANIQAIDTVAREMLSEAEANRLKQLRVEAGEKSQEEGLNKSLRAYFDSLLGKKELAAKAREEVNAKPVYQAMDTAKSEGGISRESVVQAFGEPVVKELSRWRGLVRASGGVDISELALAAGFENAEALVDALRTVPGKAVEIREAVHRTLVEREAALRREMGLDENRPGEEEYYNDERLKTLLLETRALERKAGNPRRAGTAEINRKWARNILEEMPTRDALAVGRHSAAEARAAAMSAKALAKGNAKEAAESKLRQAVNHAMVLEALDMRRQQGAFQRALRRFAASKKMDFACQEQILGLAERYGLGGTARGMPRYAPRKPEERANLGQFIENLTKDDTFGAPPFSDFILNENIPDRLSMGQLEEIWDVVRWLAAEGSPGEARMITEGVSGSLKSVAEEGAAVLRTSGNSAPVREEGTLGRTVTDKWRYVFASLNEFKDMMMRADGYQEIGPQGSHKKGFHSRWHQRIMDAQNEMSGLYRKEIKPELRRIEYVREGFIRRFEKQLGKRVPEINGVGTPDVMKSIGRNSWTAEHVWCLARNMGNAGNLKTLHQGLDLNMEQLRAVTSLLTADEWLAVQAEGDLLGRFYERTDSVFRKVYGRPMPEKVAPQELEVQTADGQTLSLPGWYFPISIDARLDPAVKEKGQMDLIEADPNFTAYGPSLARSHTKGRTGTGRPTGLYFGVFEQALRDQLRFMTHAPVLRDFDRITRNPEWRKAYVAAFGQQAYDVLRPTLKYIARPVSERAGALEGFLARQRQLATLFILGWNVKTFVRQFQGLMPGAVELGAGWTARGMGRVYRSPVSAIAAIDRLSPFMAERAKGFDRDMREAVNNYKARFKVRVGDRLYTENDVHEFTMSLITLGDKLAVYPLWQGAYIKAQEQLDMEQKEAVAYADSIVQKTNASAMATDLTPLQQKGGAWRLFTMFMGESLRKGSRMRYWWGAYSQGSIGIGRYAYHLAMESIVPSLFFVGLTGMLSDDDPDNEDLAVAVFNELAGPYPFISGVAGALQYNKPLTQSTVFTGVESLLKTGKNTYSVFDNPNSAEAWARLYKSTVDLAAYQAGVGNVRRLYETAAQGWEDMEMDRTKNPFRLFFRKPKD